MAEKCARCGEIEEDRRTLWMACFYAMEELGLPFDELRLVATGRKERIGTKVFIQGHDRFPTITGPEYGEEKKYEKPEEFAFYTLRVCKDCRANWLESIKTWFENPPKKEEWNEGDIPIRVLGTTRKMT